MAFSINTNINSLQAQNYLQKSSAFQAQTISEVTSGLRIVNSGDDAAGLAIANGLRSNEAVLTQGIQNANNGLATLQTIDGGMSNISTLLDRARTLATESASGTFTGDRGTLNSEFQSVISEVTRQATSIGMNQGGQFAQNLSVFIGGGQGATSAAASINGSITLNLSNATVDAQSLGLTGVQAEGNTAVDLSASSSTSVQNIVGDTTNKSSETNAGYTGFTFKGAGFSDASAIGVSVNLSGVTDAQTLVTAINSAIATAGNGTTAAATAFKNANISASVVSDAGGQHIAFASGNSAFQVQAGDQTSNALLGNIATGGTGVTGAALNTTFAGSGTLGNFTTTTATQANTIKLQVQGGGMTSPTTLSVNVTAGETLQSVMSSLSTAVTANTALAKAGISLNTTDSVAGGHLTFQSNSGQQFSVIAGGDTDNLLGMGTNQLAANGSVQYASTTSATAYDNTTKSGTANFQFSFNGAASNTSATLPATSGQVTGGTVVGSSGTVNTSTANQLTLQVNGTVHTIDLTSGSHNGATESLTQVAADITTALGGAGSANVNQSGQLVIQSSATGTASSVQVLQGGTGDASAVLGLTSGTGIDTTAATGKASAPNTAATSIAVNLNAGPANGGDATAGTIVGGTANTTNGTVNTSSANQLTLKVDNTQYTVDLTASSHNGATESLAQVATDISTALGSHGSATVNQTGQLVITSSSFGATSNVQVVTGGSGDASAALGLTSGSGAVTTNATGVSRSGANIASYLNQQFAQSTTMSGAGLTASFASGHLTVASTNNTQFQLNAFGTNQPATVTGTGSGSSAQLSVNSAGPFTITAANQNLGVTVDSKLYQVTLATGTYTTNTQMNTLASSIATQIVSQGGTGVTSSYTNGAIVINSATTGTSSNVSIGNNNVNDFQSTVTFGSVTPGTTSIGANATGLSAPGAAILAASTNNTLSISLTNADGTTSTVGGPITLTDNSTLSQVATQIQTALTAAGQTGWTADTLGGVSHNQLEIYNTAQGTSTTATATHIAVTGNGAANLGLSSSSGTVDVQASVISTQTGNQTITASNNTFKFDLDGTEKTVTFATGSTSMATIASQINTQANASIATVNGGGHLVLTSTTAGAAGSIAIGTVNDEFDAASTLGLTGATATGTTNYAVTGANNTLSFKVDGGSTQSVTIANQTYASASALATAINTALAAQVPPNTSVTAGSSNGALTLSSTTPGAGHSVQAVSTGGLAALAGLSTTAVIGQDANVGYGSTGVTFTGNTQGAALTAAPNVLSAGSYQANGYSFSALANGSDTQIISISATDSSGAAHAANITLQNNTGNQSGATIDSAVNAINTQLQQSNNSALQDITAVKQNVGGKEQISFVSASQQFSVTVGNTGSGTGLSGGGTTVKAAVTGTGSTADISTAQGALTAVNALANAVQSLGTAQAAVGKGENNLNYAVSLAQSQVTNEASAESQIRDANLAQQAANLTKAQILVQAGTAALSQANSAPQQLISLLQGH